VYVPLTTNTNDNKRHHTMSTACEPLCEPMIEHFSIKCRCGPVICSSWRLHIVLPNRST